MPKEPGSWLFQPLENAACTQGPLESSHSMKRIGSMPRTSSANNINTAEQPAAHHPPGGGPQTPGQQSGGAHQTATGQHRSNQQHRRDQATGHEGSGPEGSVLQPLLARQNSRGVPSANGGIKATGHAR